MRCRQWLAGFEIKGIKQVHPNDSYGYSFKKDGRKVVYATDSEHQEESEAEDYGFILFAQGADILIFDAQYRLADHLDAKKTWGHSSNIVGVEITVRAKVKKLCLFHTEHTFDDHEVEAFLKESREYLDIYTEGSSTLEIHMAFDGKCIDLSNE